ncbi:hypothetical protein L7F22_022738 [Adiantum nelumboides]|nr:hypothetical protein [Adiantum nelumboides]
MESGYDKLREDERPLGVAGSNASNEATRDVTRTSRVQWKNTNEDAHQVLSSSSGSSNALASHQDELSSTGTAVEDFSREPLAGPILYNNDVGTKATDTLVHKPLSRARICLEDSLSELKILVGHIQAASYVFLDLHLFTSSYPREKKKHPPPFLLRWPSTGRERAWPHMSDWQHRYLYDSPREDFRIRPEFPPSTKPEPPDKFYDSTKQAYETSSSGKHDTCMEPHELQTPYQDQPSATVGEQGINQVSRKSLYSKAEPATVATNGMRKSFKKQVLSSDAPDDVYGERDSQPANASHSEIEKDNGASTSQQSSAATPVDTMQTPVGMRKSMMMTKPSLSRQASARVSRAVAFMAQPEFSRNFDDVESSQMQIQPQTPAARQSGVLGRSSMASQPRSLQTDIALANYQVQDTPQLNENSPSFNTRQSRLSTRKSNMQAPGYDQSANFGDFTPEGREGDIKTDKSPLPNTSDFDSTNLFQTYDQDEDSSSTLVEDQSQDYQQTTNNPNVRKSVSNLKGRDVDASQGGDTRRQTYQITGQDTAADPRKTILKQGSSAPPDVSNDVGKSFATRQSQYATPPLPETRKSVAVNRRSQEANMGQPDVIEKSVAPDVRKSVAPVNRKNEFESEVSSNKISNQQNQFMTVQPNMRKSVASMQQPLASASFSGAARHSMRLPNPSTGELRKSVYQGPNIEEPTSAEQTSGPLSEEVYDSHQEGDSSDTTSSESSSSGSSMGSPEVVPDEPASTLAGPLTRLPSSDSTNLQNLPRMSSMPARPSSSGGNQPAMHASPTRGKSLSYISFDGNSRGPDERMSVRRRSR